MKYCYVAASVPFKGAGDEFFIVTERWCFALKSWKWKSDLNSSDPWFIPL